MNIILFGPPGIGKSTIIGNLKLKGTRAIDLEDLYPSKVRFQLPNVTAQLEETVFLGGADLDPKRKYPKSVKVLLIADQQAYDARRAKRDAGQSGKATQSHHSVDQWKTDDFDFSIDTTGRTAEWTTKELLSIVKGGQLK